MNLIQYCQTWGGEGSLRALATRAVCSRYQSACAGDLPDLKPRELVFGRAGYTFINFGLYPHAAGGTHSTMSTEERGTARSNPKRRSATACVAWAWLLAASIIGGALLLVPLEMASWSTTANIVGDVLAVAVLLFEITGRPERSRPNRPATGGPPWAMHQRHRPSAAQGILRPAAPQNRAPL